MTKHDEEMEWLRRLRNRHVARLCDYVGASPMLANSIKHQLDLLMDDVEGRYLGEEQPRRNQTHDDTEPDGNR
jgi:hypothetical protein